MHASFSEESGEGRLPPHLHLCLRELRTHCETLSGEKDGLEHELQALRAELQSTRVECSPQPALPGCLVKGSSTSQLEVNGRHDRLMTTLSCQSRQSSVDVGPTHSAGDGKKEQVVIASAQRLRMINEPPDNLNEEAMQKQTLAQVLKAFAITAEPAETFAERVVNSVVFRGVCTSAIVGNSIYLGAEADHQVYNAWRRIEGKDLEKEWMLGDILFCVWFSLELLLRAAAEGRSFLSVNNSEFKWNMLDFVLVFESIMGQIYKFGTSFAWLRLMRVCRLVRIVRLVRSIQCLRQLRTMIFSIMNCFADLLWAFVVIILIVFVFGIIFDQAVSQYFLTVDPKDEAQIETATEIKSYFGSLYETMVSLWCAISGGNDWMLYGELLRALPHGEVYFLLFCFYVAFCVVGLLNVVTGIFVDSAVCARTEDEIAEGYKEELRRTIEEVKQIFVDADTDNSGTINLKELEEHLKTSSRVQAYFAGLDIDPSEASSVFTLIDKDASGELTFEEFVNGTIKLQGKARSIDMVSLMYDTSRLTSKIYGLCTFLEDQFSFLHNQMSRMRDCQNALDKAARSTTASCSSFQGFRANTPPLANPSGPSAREEIEVIKSELRDVSQAVKDISGVLARAAARRSNRTSPPSKSPQSLASALARGADALQQLQGDTGGDEFLALVPTTTPGGVASASSANIAGGGGRGLLGRAQAAAMSKDMSEERRLLE
eukprot:TRINITY_DN22061_c0_g1_i1.p1 TRINITY_DN22061_c0_g1~~TRINITY_DN22061_c0_g1_i1.p1  ORF type:complete len:715 (+),score=195.15 TRINITY_DN22061_c0_g1_i1:224-2368(+)